MSRLPRVLGVDDNSRNLAILRRALANQCELLTAASGEEALEIAPRFRPDIVLLDIMMPGIDGYETCRRLRANPETTNAKIILVSAKALTTERLEGYASGCDDYVIKPFDADELAAKVRVYSRLKSVEEVDRLRGDLLTLLSHETRTPLTAILSPLPLLLMGENLTEAQRNLVRTVEAGATRMLRLIEKGSFLARLRAGDVPGEAKPRDFGVLVDAAVRRNAEAAEARGVRLEVEHDGDATVETDEYVLGQALDVLLDNAIRFSPKEGAVRLRVWSSDNVACLSVADSGPGIPLETRPHLFDLFTVADVRLHAGGHGMGLATARAIAELYGGRLWLDESRSSGTCFNLAIPRACAKRAAA